MKARCTRCGQIRPVAEFMEHRPGRSDRSRYCAQCRTASPELGVRWGRGLVCDCEPSEILGCGQCVHCGLPAVASMAPHLRDRMAVLCPPSARQTVTTAKRRAKAS